MPKPISESAHSYPGQKPSSIPPFGSNWGNSNARDKTRIERSYELSNGWSRGRPPGHGGGGVPQSTGDAQTGDVGQGVCLTIGLGAIKKGTQLSFGIFGRPGTFGQAFLSVGHPALDFKYFPAYLDCSISAQYLIGWSQQGKIDLSGDSKAYGAGWGPVAGGYSKSTDIIQNVTVLQGGVAVGYKYTGGAINTKTYTIPVFFPMLFTLVGLKY